MNNNYTSRPKNNCVHVATSMHGLAGKEASFLFNFAVFKLTSIIVASVFHETGKVVVVGQLVVCVRLCVCEYCITVFSTVCGS